jgi:hypothetical protein
LGIMVNLQKAGMLESNVDQENLKELKDAILWLKTTYVRLDKYYYEEMAAVICRLQKVTPSCGNVPETIADAITHLRHVLPERSRQGRHGGRDKQAMGYQFQDKSMS